MGALLGITRVKVSYSTPIDDPEGRRLCTSRGNNITVIFEDAAVPPFDDDSLAATDDCTVNGDLPELEVLFTFRTLDGFIAAAPQLVSHSQKAIVWLLTRPRLSWAV